MDCLDAIYDWKVKPTNDSAEKVAVAHSSCRCTEISSVELEVQQLRAKAELALLRDRVRKAFTIWLAVKGSSTLAAPPVRIEWKVKVEDLVPHLCYWQHTSALTKIAMTPCLAELTQQHRKLEGASQEPPASKNKLTLVVWNLAATVQAKLQQWHNICMGSQDALNFVGVIVVRTSDLIPIWMWEADILRHRPALVDVCNRMLSMEMYQYRQSCNQLSPLETKLTHGGQTPDLTPFGLTWPNEPDHPSEFESQRSLCRAQTKRKKVFIGETFCVSGTFSVSQQAIVSLIIDHGGTIAGSVNRFCTYLVAENMGSAKTKKAQAQGIPIVTEAWVRASISARKKSPLSSLFLANSPTNHSEPSASSYYNASLPVRSSGVILMSAANSRHDVRRSDDMVSAFDSDAEASESSNDRHGRD